MARQKTSVQSSAANFTTKAKPSGPATFGDLVPIRSQDRSDIRDFLDWLATSPRVHSVKTHRTYRQAAQGFASFTAARGMPLLADVTREHVEAFIGWMRAKGNKPATLRNRYVGLRALFNWMLQEDLRKEHPMARIKPPQVPDQVQPDYKPEQILALLDSIPARDVIGLRDRAIISLFYDAGIRAAELCDIRLGHVDRESRHIVIETGKGGKGRRVGYAHETANALNRYVRRRGGWDSLSGASPLFAAKDGSALTPNAIRMLMQRRFAAAGIEFRGTHAFRRSWAMAYLDAGGDPMNLKELAGWSSLAMLYRYTKRAAQERALRSVDQFSPMARLATRRRERD